MAEDAVQKYLTDIEDIYRTGGGVAKGIILRSAGDVEEIAAASGIHRPTCGGQRMNESETRAELIVPKESFKREAL